VQATQKPTKTVEFVPCFLYVLKTRKTGELKFAFVVLSADMRADRYVALAEPFVEGPFTKYRR
jgi:hypothetical protein